MSDEETYERIRNEKMRDRFFCRLSWCCHEVCSQCDAYGQCFACANEGKPDKCQYCTREYEEAQDDGTAAD